MPDKIETWVAMEDDERVFLHEGRPHRFHREWITTEGQYVQIDGSIIPDITPGKPRRVIGLVLEPLAEEGP